MKKKSAIASLFVINQRAEGNFSINFSKTIEKLNVVANSNFYEKDPQLKLLFVVIKNVEKVFFKN